MSVCLLGRQDAVLQQSCLAALHQSTSRHGAEGLDNSPIYQAPVGRQCPDWLPTNPRYRLLQDVKGVAAYEAWRYWAWQSGMLAPGAWGSFDLADGWGSHRGMVVAKCASGRWASRHKGQGGRHHIITGQSAVHQCARWTRRGAGGRGMSPGGRVLGPSVAIATCTCYCAQGHKGIMLRSHHAGLQQGSREGCSSWGPAAGGQLDSGRPLLHSSGLSYHGAKAIPSSCFKHRITWEWAALCGKFAPGVWIAAAKVPGGENGAPPADIMYIAAAADCLAAAAG
jgi:hypothetical protein